jgi:hypothetical protein
VVKDFDGGGYITPAPLADLLIRTARSDLVVIRHIDIKDQLSSLRDQCTRRQRLPVSRLKLSAPDVSLPPASTVWMNLRPRSGSRKLDWDERSFTPVGWRKTSWCMTGTALTLAEY